MQTPDFAGILTAVNHSFAISHSRKLTPSPPIPRHVGSTSRDSHDVMKQRRNLTAHSAIKLLLLFFSWAERDVHLSSMARQGAWLNCYKARQVRTNESRGHIVMGAELWRNVFQVCICVFHLWVVSARLTWTATGLTKHLAGRTMRSLSVTIWNFDFYMVRFGLIYIPLPCRGILVSHTEISLCHCTN